MKGNIRKVIKEIFIYRFNLDEDKASEEQIIETLKKNVEFKGTNLWALIFAIFIASIGLNVNSTAVIIGAMLISPLMGPIMGIGLGAGIFDFRLIRYSLKNLFVAVGISVLTSALYFWISPINTAQSELLARTSPTLWDVLIALFGGLAGIIASSRKNISNVIPGVAIATALMPPLCTAGYGIGTGNLYYFAGAFYLFLINSVFISISTFLIVRFLKFKPRHLVVDETERKVRKYIWTIAILTILPSLYLAYCFVQEEVFRQNITRFVTSEIDARNLYTLNRKVDANGRKATLLIYGTDLNDSLLDKLTKRQAAYGFGNNEVTLQSALTRTEVPADVPVLREETEEQFKLLMEKDAKIKALEMKIRMSQKPDTAFNNEFRALFGGTTELALSKVLVYNKDNKGDTAILLYIKPEKKISNTGQIKSWLMARYRTNQVKVLLE